jgi:hypothetical protein
MTTLLLRNSRLDVTVAKQETTGAQQQKEIKALIATVKEQASQIQKVSGQLERANLRRKWSLTNSNRNACGKIYRS